MVVVYRTPMGLVFKFTLVTGQRVVVIVREPTHLHARGLVRKSSRIPVGVVDEQLRHMSFFSRSVRDLIDHAWKILVQFNERKRSRKRKRTPVEIKYSCNLNSLRRMDDKDNGSDADDESED